MFSGCGVEGSGVEGVALKVDGGKLAPSSSPIAL